MELLFLMLFLASKRSTCVNPYKSWKMPPLPSDESLDKFGLPTMVNK